MRETKVILNSAQSQNHWFFYKFAEKLTIWHPMSKNTRESKPTQGPSKGNESVSSTESSQTQISGKRKPLFYIMAGTLLLLLILAYSNHFRNTFHFDDSHVIVNNIYIRDIKNIPLFFKDASTISSLPANQSYRPMLATSLAIDYWFGKGLNPIYFQFSTFCWYILQCLLMFFIFLRIMNIAQAHKWNTYAALLAVGWYALHTANAETINYISARSDSLSTFFMLLSMFMMLYMPKSRRWLLYLIPVVVGILVKPAILVYPGLLFFYILYFEENSGLKSALSKIQIKKISKALYLIIPSLLVCGLLYYFQGKMTPETFTPGGKSRFSYMITQPFVVLHYFQMFFLPNELSADSDWTALDSILNYKFFSGSLFICILLIIAFLTSEKKQYRPISFGILWFFMALLPSSSIIPFGEVMNDHRTFFPYIGLVLSISWSLYLLIIAFEKEILKNKSYKAAIFFGIALLLGGHAYGTYQRNKVWSSDESLWQDVTIKSPNNGRGLMNYGLTLMAKGDYIEAEEYFKKAQERWPYYSYLYVNFGILKEAMKDPSGAEFNYKKALQYGPYNPECYYYYGRFLSTNNRKSESIDLLSKCLELSPGHIYTRYLLMGIYAEDYEWAKLADIASTTLQFIANDKTALYYLEFSKNKKTKIETALESIRKSPTAEGYLQLSLLYYNSSNYTACIEACNEALKINPNYAEAYNNICSAYNQLGKWDEAVNACEKSIQLKPSFELASNNLRAIKSRKLKVEKALQITKEKPTAENFLNLSLAYYGESMFKECIDAAQTALKIKPGYAQAYNNICSAYNNLKMWDEAINAGEQALKYDPNFVLAKNNVAFAKNQKGKN